MNGLYLFAQIIFFLIFIDALFYALRYAFFGGEHFPAGNKLCIYRLQLVAFRINLQDALTIRVVVEKIIHEFAYQPVNVYYVGLRNNVLIEFCGILQRAAAFFLYQIDKSLGLGVICRDIFTVRRNRRHKRSNGNIFFHHHTAFATHYGPRRIVGQSQNLRDFCGRSHLVCVVRQRFIYIPVLLCDHEDIFVFCASVFYNAQNFVVLT